MKIKEIRYSTVIVEDQGRDYMLFEQGDYRVKCLTCNRYGCEHVLFVQAQHVTFPKPPPLTDEQLRDLIDE